MYVSARERLIIEILVSQKREITIKDLADEIDVSVRTIHRDLKGIEDILREFNLELIKKSGVGIQIAGEEANIQELKLTLFNLSHNEYTPDERQTVILCTLLEATEPVKLIALANDLNVTIATIANDLNKLEERLKTFNLSLIKKRGYGIEVSGIETAKRRAMSSILAENIDEVDVLSLVRENIQKRSIQQTDSTSERLLGLVEKKKLLIVERVIEEINAELPYSIADSAYIGLVVHLALAMERILQGENINIDHAYLESLQLTPEYKVAEKIIRKLEKVFDTSIPAAEIGYITMHLQGAKLRHDKEYLVEDSSFQIAVKAKRLMQFIEEQLNYELTDNRSLFQGLVAHLKPALYRIKQNMGIHNPLLTKIKEDYEDLFILVKEGAEKIFPELSIPDEEIGYLVMHFGSALLGDKKMEDIKALIICSSGIGTSKMLATRLKQELPEIKHLQNVSLFQLNQMDTKMFDLVLSTIRLPDFSNEYILVSPMLTEEEIENIRSRIKRQSHVKSLTKQTALRETEVLNYKSITKTIEAMQVISQYSKAITTILKGFRIIKLDESHSVQDVLTEACKSLYEHGIIKDTNLVVQALIEREKLGGLGIPNTSLSLFHSRDDQVLSPTFIICSLEQPLPVKAMDGTVIETGNILLLLSPEQPSTPILEALSFISSLVIDTEESISLFESQDQQLISSYIAAKFEQFFDEKIKEIRSV